MNFKDAEEICKSFNTRPVRTLLIFLFLVFAVVLFAYIGGFFGEKGKQDAVSIVENGNGIPPSRQEPEKKKDTDHSKNSPRVSQHTEGDQSPAQNIGPGGSGTIIYGEPKTKQTRD
jgi:hypothetical protein